MTSAVHLWKQAGRVFVWRYPPHRKKYRGWHFTCDHAGCDGLTKLIEAMRTGAEPSKRSITLSPATPEVWAVPNFGQPTLESHPKMVLRYEPDYRGLSLSDQEGCLSLDLGDVTAPTLLDALRDLKAGGGDYVLPSNDADAPPIWIWWMLRSAN